MAIDACVLLRIRDAAAFDAVMTAIRMPKDSDEEKAARSAALQRATAEPRPPRWRWPAEARR